MEKEQELMLKQALIEQELEFVRNQLKIVRLFMYEHQKELYSPSSPISQEENVSVQKNTEQQEVNVSPPLKRKEMSSPKQTDPDFNLRPNGGIQIPKTEGSSSGSGSPDKGIQIPKELLQIPNKNSKPYHVVFNGPNAGIFEDWNITKKATEGIKNIKGKKFNNFLEAKITADQYTRSERCSELQLITEAETLRPNTFKLALNSTKSSKTILGSLPRRTPKINEEGTPDLRIEIKIKDFKYCYRYARSATEENFVEEKFSTIDGKNLSDYTIYKNANYLQVYEAFQLGLVKTIYPSQNLQEIKIFSKSFTKAIKTFRTRCYINDRYIFLKFNSSTPYWNDNDEIKYHPHHLVQISICKQETYLASKAMEEKLERTYILQLAKSRIEIFINKVFSFSADDKIFINGYDANEKTLIYRKYNKEISPADEQLFLAFQNSLLKSDLIGEHVADICKTLHKITNRYNCQRCSTIKVASTTENNNRNAIIKEDSSTTTK
ncbi:unnamed protein product [Lactuca virosa]|uniref:Ribonuclease H1 N-terminal domain-containing protein n=1 Tax=Lactuca virosa TaxID=75947 RepID=A0AAU9N155_9ASTR|nr:unnamed protein product [Lactuca virosa]